MKRTVKKLGECPVDSGQLFITDPCYIKNGDWEKMRSSTAYDSKSYTAVMAATLGYDPLSEEDPPPYTSSLHAGEVENGVAFSTQIGDGSYPVYGVYDNDGNLLRVVVKIQ